MHPVLFEVFGFSVHAYGVALTTSYLIGVVLGIWLSRRDGHAKSDLLEIAVVVVLAAVLGSKLFHVLFEAKGHMLSDGRRATGVADLLHDDPWHWARLFEPGYVFYGGVVGAVVVGILFCWRRGVPDIGAIGDNAVPGLACGIFLGRVGCFLAGCCHGAPSALPWAVTFPLGHPSHGVPVHPVQLYDAAFGVVELIAAVFLFPRRRFGGELLVFFFVSYAAWRTCTELLRGDSDRGLWFNGHVSTSQGIAVATLAVSIALWRYALVLVHRGKLKKPGVARDAHGITQDVGAR